MGRLRTLIHGGDYPPSDENTSLGPPPSPPPVVADDWETSWLRPFWPSSATEPPDLSYQHVPDKLPTSSRYIEQK